MTVIYILGQNSNWLPGTMKGLASPRTQCLQENYLSL